MLLALIMIATLRSNAGTGALTITNHALCSITVTMYASGSAGSCSAACGTYISSSFTLLSGQTLSWCSAYEFQTTGGCASSVGWATYPTSCGLFGSPCASDFQWNQATWSYSGCSVGTCTPDYTASGVVDNQCNSTSCTFPTAGATWGTSTSSCPYGTFSPSCSGATGNVVIDIY